MNNEELKPCPFCGGEAEVVFIKEELYVRCRECGAVGANTFNTEDVLADWNRRVCVKQNSEMLDTNSVASSGVNTSSVCKENLQAGPRLTYTDIERMVKPLEWSYRRIEDRGDCEYAFISKNRAFKVVGCLGDCRLIFWDKFGSVIDTLAIVEDGERDLDVQKQNARKFLVDLVADALGVERS